MSELQVYIYLFLAMVSLYLTILRKIVRINLAISEKKVRISSLYDAILRKSHN